MPTMCKLLTSALAEKLYALLSEKNVLLDMQKRCRKDSPGMKDQLLIDKQILKHCKEHQRNLIVWYIDYKRAYDMVPHGWMTETKKKVGIAYNIVNLFETWRTELTACNESLWKVYIRRFLRGILFHLTFLLLLLYLYW